MIQKLHYKHKIILSVLFVLNFFFLDARLIRVLIFEHPETKQKVGLFGDGHFWENDRRLLTTASFGIYEAEFIYHLINEFVRKSELKFGKTKIYYEGGDYIGDLAERCIRIDLLRGFFRKFPSYFFNPHSFIDYLNSHYSIPNIINIENRNDTEFSSLVEDFKVNKDLISNELAFHISFNIYDVINRACVYLHNKFCVLNLQKLIPLELKKILAEQIQKLENYAKLWQNLANEFKIAITSKSKISLKELKENYKSNYYRLRMRKIKLIDSTCSMLDINFILELIENVQAKKILLFAGDAHIERIIKYLEILGYKNIFNSNKILKEFEAKESDLFDDNSYSFETSFDALCKNVYQAFLND